MLNHAHINENERKERGRRVKVESGRERLEGGGLRLRVEGRGWREEG